jgi:hypothetical protein
LPAAPLTPGQQHRGKLERFPASPGSPSVSAISGIKLAMVLWQASFSEKSSRMRNRLYYPQTGGSIVPRSYSGAFSG